MVDIEASSIEERLSYDEVLDLADMMGISRDRIVFRKRSKLRIAIIGTKDNGREIMTVNIVGEYRWDGCPKEYGMRRMEEDEIQKCKYRIYVVSKAHKDKQVRKT